MTAAGSHGAVVSFLESTLGLSFSGPRRDRLLAAVDAERDSAGLSPEEYLAAIRLPGPTFDRLVARVTVGETSFFRDRAQCELLRDVVLPSVARARGAGSAVAMWSAGCSSGEEAYTLAALADAAGLGDRWVVVGSDASREAIEKARHAEYGPWSMRSTGPTELAAHFRQEAGRYRVVDRLRRRTEFVQRNLLDGPPPPGRFDAVLCRNLLIYLTPDAVRQAAEVLAAALTPEGWLLTAAGDPPLESPDLRTVRTRHGAAYRRADAVAPPGATTSPAATTRTRSTTPSARSLLPTPARTAPAPPAVALPAAAPPSTARPSTAPGHGRRGTTVPAPRATGAGPPPGDLARRIRELGDAGRIADACAAAADAVLAHPLDVELRYLAGVVLLEAGRLDEAATAAAGAVYLGPDLAATHVLLGQVEHARGNTTRARRSFRNGSRLLAGVAGETPVALTGDLPAGHLAAVVDRYLTTPGTAR